MFHFLAEVIVYPTGLVKTTMAGKASSPASCPEDSGSVCHVVVSIFKYEIRRK